jgi:hypothetical protein
VGADGSYTVSATPGKNRVSYSAPSLEADRELKPGEAPPQSPYRGLTPKQAEVEVKSGATLDIELQAPKK